MTEEIGPYKIIMRTSFKITLYKSKKHLAPQCGCKVQLPANQEIACIEHTSVDETRNTFIRQQIWIPIDELQDLGKVLNGFRQ